MFSRSVATGAVIALLACASAFAQAVPKEMTWTAYDAGSSGFNIAVAIAQQVKEALGSDVRVLPSGNDTGRLAPLKANRAVVAQMGTGVYFAQEGVFEFGNRSWGPQPVRLMMSASACNGLGLGAAGDSGITHIKDIKGKRLGVVIGSPALTQGALALIAFAGLTEKDVTLVPFVSHNAMWQGLINNEADVAFSSTLSGQSKEAESSPRGLLWPAMPADDKEGWARVRKKAPYFLAQKVTCGSGGLSPSHPVEMASYAYPIFMAYAGRPADTIYAITNAMIDTYRAYKDSVAGAEGMALEKQNLTWVVPYHDGAIRALKEKGAWGDKAQKHNDVLLKRQQVMINAWKAYGAGAPADEKAFGDGWMKARAAALAKAAMDVVFE
jgi:TRAP transporter TAXI family solute receptor